MKKKPYIRSVILGILATLMVGCIPEAILLRKGNLIQKSRYLSIFRWGQEYTGWSCPTNAPGMPSRSAM